MASKMFTVSLFEKDLEMGNKTGFFFLVLDIPVLSFPVSKDQTFDSLVVKSEEPNIKCLEIERALFCKPSFFLKLGACL